MKKYASSIKLLCRENVLAAFIAGIAITGIIGLCVTLLQVACAPQANVAGRSTANLTAPGIAALHAAEIVKVLDVIRDTAIDGAAAHLISDHTARSIVTWHQAALNTMRRVPNGWKTTVLAGLDALKTTLTANEQKIIGPYIDSAIFTIKAVV